MTRVGQELLEIAGEKLRYRKNLTLTDWLGLRLGTAKWLLAAEIELFMTLGGVEAVETAFRQRKKINFAYLASIAGWSHSAKELLRKRIERSLKQ